MKVEVSTVGALNKWLPRGREIIEGGDLDVQKILTALTEKHGPDLAGELLKNGQLRPDLALLVNGRNVLSLPEKWRTTLKDGDEILITIMVAGG